MSRNAAPRICRVCRTGLLIRLYFNGWACDEHAPAEPVIRAAAIAKAKANDARRARIAKTPAGRAHERAVATRPDQETR